VRDVDGASEELEQLRLQAARFAQSEQELNELRQQLSRLREKDGGNGESAADSSELLLVRQRQLDVLLEGAALHERETAQLQQRLGEMEKLAEKLHHERDELELQLSDCRRQAERDGERHELLRREVTDLGRQLAVAQGQLKRLGEGEAATPPASAGESETSAELARERGERRRLQGELEARLDQLDALRREVDARQRELDDLRSEDTERRAEVLELRRQVRQLERAAAARPSGDADGRPFDWAQDAEPELRRRCQELEREVQRQRRLRGDCQAELERFTREVDFLREQLAERQAELKAQRAQLEKRP